MTTLATDDPVGRYRPSGSAHDEMIDGAGAVRAHWVKLAESYQALGATELARRKAEIALLLEQDGVTYNVADDPRRPHRPWELDPLPLVIPSDEWAVIERGMTQRAELLDLVLRDVYGERKLLGSGAIPPELVLGDPSFLRACDGIALPSDETAGRLRHRSHAWLRWRLAGHRQPDPGPIRRGLRPGKPPHPVAGLPQSVPQRRRAPARPVRSVAPCRPPSGGPCRRRGPLHRRPVAGCAVRNRIRACLHRQPARLSAGAGKRPRGARRKGVAAQCRRADAGPRHPAAPRCLVL